MTGWLTVAAEWTLPVDVLSKQRSSMLSAKEALVDWLACDAGDGLAAAAGWAGSDWDWLSISDTAVMYSLHIPCTLAPRMYGNIIIYY